MGAHLKINPEGNDYWVRGGGGSNRHSGGASHRGRNVHAKIARELAEKAATYTIVLFCNDQAGCRGTGYRGKFDSDHHVRRKAA